MEIKHAYVKSRTLKDDYHWVPGNGKGAGSRLDKICASVRSPEWGAVIIQDGGLIYFMSEGIRTKREDPVHRPVYNQALFQVDSIETAIALYDSTQRLVDWSERYFENPCKTGYNEVKQLIASTPRRSIGGFLRSLTDSDTGAKVYILPKKKTAEVSASKKTGFWKGLFGG
jgi:hypothetical protein